MSDGTMRTDDDDDDNEGHTPKSPQQRVPLVLD